MTGSGPQNRAVLPPEPSGSNPSNRSGLDGEAVDSAMFAWEWARMLVDTSWVAADRTVIAEQLRGLTRRLVHAMEQEPFVPAAGIAIGRSLVEIGFASADALARTSTLISQQFLPGLGLAVGPVGDTGIDEPGLRNRLAELVGMLCLGFVRAVRDRTLEEQEAIRSSSLLALERAKADQQASARRDSLTGLLNRNGFTAELGRLIEQSPPGVVGVCLLSLNGFEAMERGLGRDVGDRVLLVVAERLAARFAGRHELFARAGRDEFIVAAIDAPRGRGPQDTLAERLAAAQCAVRESIVLDDQTIRLSTSFGVVARPTELTDPEGILRDADLAASWSRDREPGSVTFFDGDRAARQISDLALTAELPTALQDGRLRPYYQPIVSLRTGEIEAVEALARWSHPDHGLLPPDRFLHLAERGGLMTTLGRSVLRQACVQGHSWSTSLEQAPVIAVNLAAVQLVDPTTVSDVISVLELTGLAPELLQLEITEHAALADPGTLRIIRDLARVGVGLALDDFGTGRAHLAQLAELPAHGVATLKLPADFLHGRPGSDERATDEARVHVLGGMIDMAHGLGMQVTVEGIETAGQHALVLGLGADLAQGSHYAAPATAAEIADLLGSH